MNLVPYFAHYDAFLDVAISKAKTKGSGGAVRAQTGKLVESLAELIWATETKGTVKKESYQISNPVGDKLQFSVDKHCYSVNGKLKLILECKAYLDRCFLARADHDISMIKLGLGRENRGVKFGILALENAAADDALNFYLGHNNIDEIFFLLDGKRTSSKPIWDEAHRKSMNPQLLKEFVGYVQKLK